MNKMSHMTKFDRARAIGLLHWALNVKSFQAHESGGVFHLQIGLKGQESW